MHHRQRGFTLVELTFVMAFLSILLLSILYVALQTGKIYTKGVTNRDMNQLTRDLGDTIRRDISAVDPAGFQPMSAGVPRDYVELGTGNTKSGRLCLGTVSYVWNTAGLLNSGISTAIKDKNGAPVTFLRVLDTGASLCVKNGAGAYTMQLPASLATSSLLDSSGRTLAVYDMQFAELSKKGQEALYQMQVTIGTNDQGTTTQATAGDAATTQCKPPTDNSADFNYCSITVLNMILRAGGKSS